MRFKKVAGGGAEAQPPVMRIVSTRGIGASDSVAFCITVGIAERSGRPPLQNPRWSTTFFRGFRSWLRHSLTHGYFLESLRDSMIRPYLNSIARFVRPQIND